ncbi:AI-2E family transporter [Mesorhizobium sp. IMUNJ 23232]|uniref:AI-2E family transporter n=1 Tax=Mesorhizobium sp. IMUNJ 23232 TaxID=3376064 RepID=UPI003797EF21
MTEKIELRPTLANGSAEQTTYPPLVGIVATIAALYFGRTIFLPLATAILLTFALAPAVTALRKLRIPRPIAVVSVVIGAFAAIVLFGMILASQLGSLAQNLPLYQRNVEIKMQSIMDADFGEGLYSRVSRLFERLGRQIEANQPTDSDKTVDLNDAPSVPPLPVQVIEPAPQPLQVLQTIAGPLLEPLATGGIVVVVVIFMLLKREDLRDRFIRLVGSRDIHRTTEAIEDAGKRVGEYLLMQLVVNVTYAIPIGIGLWLIGVPNAPLWGLVALVLRFVPFIGPVISSIFPLTLAIAVDPGWTMLLWTAALFAVVELASNNAIEPWLYGARTGLSPLAVILAAILWTWLWGPVGLLLSTPLTVCLVVLGRHVPRFEFLEVMFGNKPVLEPHQQLYQRLLAGDPDEATERAEAFLVDDDLITFYETVAIPALGVGETDRARGVMTEERRKRVADSAMALVDNLEEYAVDEVPTDVMGRPAAAGDVEAPADANSQLKALPDGSGKTVLCVAGRGELDFAAMAMLSQVLTSQKATSRCVAHSAVDPSKIKNLDMTGIDTVVVGYLNPKSTIHARYLVRRLKRAKKSLRVGVVFWMPAEDALSDIKLTATIGCDFVARSVRDAVVSALDAEVAAVSESISSKIVRRNSRSRPRAKESSSLTKGE